MAVIYARMRRAPCCCWKCGWTGYRKRHMDWSTKTPVRKSYRRCPGCGRWNTVRFTEGSSP